MTSAEYDVLDELYFIQSYNYLADILDMNNEILKFTLNNLLKKGWIECYISPVEERKIESDKLEKDYWNYHYLATKAGLLAHNSNY